MAGSPFAVSFIIDQKGIVRAITVHDLPLGRSVDETLRVLDALQHFEKHGEVCPADWKKGGATIKPGVKESKAYFEKGGEEVVVSCQFALLRACFRRSGRGSARPDIPPGRSKIVGSRRLDPTYKSKRYTGFQPSTVSSEQIGSLRAMLWGFLVLLMTDN